jgi:O-antigen ligase
MIRTTLLLLLVAFLSVYAWRNWFVSLCGAVLLMAVVQHPDFPNSIGGIQGLNPWNILLLNIVLAWARHPREEGLVWDMPSHVSWMLFGYLMVVLVGVIRLFADMPEGYRIGDILSESLLNCVKWVIPGLLLFDACRTRERVTIALIVILAIYLLLALQVIKHMPLSSAVSGSDLSSRASKIIQNDIGYNRVTLSMMLSGASWAALGAVVIARSPLQRISLVAAAGVIALGQALTGGRTGYVSWGLLGLILGVVRWPRILIVIPIAVIAIGIAVPGVRERMLQGLGGQTGNIVVATDDYEVTSGRNLAWPLVIEGIESEPIIGFGREGMVASGIKDRLWSEYEESFPHPHQAYLELLLDNGVIGFFIVIPFYLVAVGRSFQLLAERSDPLVCAVGCAAFSLIVALMIGAFGGQTFYPREGAVGMWAAIGIMLRVSVEKFRSRETGLPLFDDEESDTTEIMELHPHGERPLPV